MLDANNIKDLVDPSLGDDYDREEMDRVVLTASVCVEQSPILRPIMSQASKHPKKLHFLQQGLLKLKFHKNKKEFNFDASHYMFDFLRT